MHSSQKIGDRATGEDDGRSPRSRTKLNRDRKIVREQRISTKSGAPAKRDYSR